MSDDERPALFIDAKHLEEDFDLDIPPATGHEYLRRVMKEAQGCPRVVIANIDTKPYLDKQTLNYNTGSGAMKAPAGLAPTTKWQQQQAADFSDVRQKLSRWKARLKAKKVTKPTHLPPRNDVLAWCRLSFGRLKPKDKQLLPSQANDAGCSDDNAELPKAAQEEPSDDSPADQQVAPDSTKVPASHTRSPPLLSIVSFMDQPTIISVLEYHVNWFEATGFSQEQGEWLYALLVCLEKPLDPEACSLLRQLARTCSTLRATLDTGGHPFLAPLNLFISLVAHYFDQKDLADDR